MVHLLLVRHGETLWNTQQRYQGHSDVPLSDVGRAQAAALAEALRLRTIDAVYASDLSRAVETAEIVCRERRLPMNRTPALRELAFGQWEGLTYDEILQAYPAESQAWLTDHRTAPPGGESLNQLQTRLQIILEQIVQEHTDQTVLIVSHGGPLKLLLATGLGLPPELFWQFRIDPGSLSEIEFYPELDLHPGGAVLMKMNYVAAANADHARSNVTWGD